MKNLWSKLPPIGCLLQWWVPAICHKWSLSSVFCPAERSINMSKYMKQVVKVKVWKPEWHPSKKMYWIHWSVKKNTFTHVLYQKNESLIYSSSQWMQCSTTSGLTILFTVHACLHVWKYKLHQADNNNEQRKRTRSSQLYINLSSWKESLKKKFRIWWNCDLCVHGTGHLARTYCTLVSYCIWLCFLW